MPHALTLVLSVILALGPESTKTSEKQRSMAFAPPGKSYALSFDLSSFDIEEDRVNEKGTGRYVMTSNKTNGVSLSFWLEPAAKEGDSKVCRSIWWAKERKGAFAPRNVSMREKGDLAIVEYSVDVASVNQFNVRAYLAYKEMWVDIHMSKLGAANAEKAEFDRLLASVKVIDPYIDSRHELAVASKLYMQKDYRKSAIHYQRVIDAEKKSRTLEKDMWRVAVDNLGMCYGMTGQLKRAKAVFEYGIQEDSEYPMFHYNQACTFAEMDDLADAIVHLKKAFALKKNMIKGEQIPNPRTDSSFKKYLGSDEFKAALREIGA